MLPGPPLSAEEHKIFRRGFCFNLRNATTKDYLAKLSTHSGSQISWRKLLTS